MTRDAVALRARILRLREVAVHRAAGTLAAAHGQARQMADNARRIAEARADVLPVAGVTDGDAFARRAQFAARLGMIGGAIDRAAASAGALVAQHQAKVARLQVEADRAARSLDECRAAADDARERRMQLALPHRRSGGGL